MALVGVDGAETQNDVLVMDEAGAVLGRRRCPVGVEGLAELHGLIAGRAEEPEQVVIGTEIGWGLPVALDRTRVRCKRPASPCPTRPLAKRIRVQGARLGDAIGS